MSRVTLSRSLMALAVATAMNHVYAADQTVNVVGTIQDWKSWNASSKSLALPLVSPTSIYANALAGIDLFQGDTVGYELTTDSPAFLSIPVTGSVTYDDATCVSNICTITALTLSQVGSFTGYYDVNSDGFTDDFYDDPVSPTTAGGGVTFTGLTWALNGTSLSQTTPTLDPVPDPLVKTYALGCDSSAPQCGFTVIGTNVNDHSNGVSQSIFDFQGINAGFKTLPKSNAGQTDYQDIGGVFKTWVSTPGVSGLTVNISTGAITLAVASRVSSGANTTNAANTANINLTAAIGPPPVDPDGDTVPSESDNCPNDANLDQLDTDVDAQGNVCDTNDDNDSWIDVVENACGSNPLDANSQCTDTDSDGIYEAIDNCPVDSNQDQLDTDEDDVGNACDATPNGDTDGDGIDSASDNCPVDSNQDQLDTDEDDVGDVCDDTPNGDTDGDGVDNVTDNCLSISNEDQLNTDEDAEGNACDATPNGDTDGDGVDDASDNCPANSNADQKDYDADGTGNVCDSTPNRKLTLTSVGSKDGWILESTETSSKGGKADSSSSLLRVGDSSSDQQYRSILDFDTSVLNNSAVIVKATLTLKKYSTVGSVSSLGSLAVDMRAAYFGSSSSLSIADFETTASKSTAATLSGITYYSSVLSTTAKSYISKTYDTQFRLRLSTGDNDDRGSDYLNFYSGNASSYKPTLVIEYYVP